MCSHNRRRRRTKLICECREVRFDHDNDNRRDIRDNRDFRDTRDRFDFNDNRIDNRRNEFRCGCCHHRRSNFFGF